MLAGVTRAEPDSVGGVEEDDWHGGAGPPNASLPPGRSGFPVPRADAPLDEVIHPPTGESAGTPRTRPELLGGSSYLLDGKY